MAFRLNFRAKLLSIAAIAALPFVVVALATFVLGGRVEEQLGAIQARSLPKLELEPELEGQFDRIRRAFQDAVAEGDVDELKTAEDAKARFLAELDAAHAALDPAAEAELRAAIDDYERAASDVSRRMIAGETGERIVEAASRMQTKQGRVTDLVARVAAVDRRELASSFGLVSRMERAAREYAIAIGAVSLALVIALSLALSRSVLRTVNALGAGLRRFGTGDFSTPIDAPARDELGLVAEHANAMAASLERLERERQRAEDSLKVSNRELEAFSYSVAHDLRAPLRGINGFSRALIDDYENVLGDEGKLYLGRIAQAAERMGELIDAMLALSRVSRAELHRERVELTLLVDAVVAQLRAAHPDRKVEFARPPSIVVHGDPVLLRAVLDNLLGNAWKFTAKRGDAKVAFGVEVEDGASVYFVRDNGAGFDMAYVAKLFTPFQRLHTSAEFAGTGVGLATVERIIRRHGGRLWAESAVGAGATFRFTLPAPPPTQSALPSLPSPRQGEPSP